MPQTDFTIETLAVHLHLTPQQIARLADRGKLPGRKVGGQWRFSRADIHHWWERRIGLSDEGELIEVEDALQRHAAAHDEPEVSLGQLLPVEAIGIPLGARTAGSVIRAMVDLAVKTGLLWDAEKMAEAVRSREEMHPTALENGVALLHPRRPLPGVLGQALITLGRTPGGISFGGSGGSLTDVFFLICSTDDRGHLRTLARLSRVLTAPDFLPALRAAPDAQAARELLIRTEETL